MPTSEPPARPRPVGGDIQVPEKTHDVKPVLPELARAARIAGTVDVAIVIDRNGHVASATVTRSVPVLDAAALDAVRQWTFAPTIVDGQAIPVTMTVTVEFSR
jgi:protein TonB